MISEAELKNKFDESIKKTLSAVEDLESFKNKDKLIKNVLKYQIGLSIKTLMS